MKTSYAQTTHLKLKTKKGLNGKTIIKDMFFTPPLKLIAPIYEDEIANLMLLNVSAGLMKDDNQDIEIALEQDSKLKLTSQSYEKIHDTQDGFAQRNTKILLEKNTFLQYMPLPCIPFANSNFINTTTIYLQENSRLYHSEIFCAGRVARNEIFAFKKFHSKLQIYKNDSLIFFDNMKLEPSINNLQDPCMFNTYTHYLNLIIYDTTQHIKSLQDKILASNLNASISTNNDIIIIKALSNESEKLLELQKQLNL